MIIRNWKLNSSASGRYVDQMLVSVLTGSYQKLETVLIRSWKLNVNEDEQEYHFSPFATQW